VSLLSFWEKNAGLTLYDLKANAVAKGTLISSDKLFISLNRSEINVTDARYDRATKEVFLKAGSEVIDPGDIAIFSSQFAHLHKPISFATEAEGLLPQITLTSFTLQYGEDTKFDISGKISDYSNFNNSNLEANIRQLRVSQEDLQDFIRIGAINYSSPVQVLNLGDFDLQLQARGKLTNFRYDGIIDTEQGTISLNGTGRLRDKFKNLEVRRDCICRQYSDGQHYWRRAGRWQYYPEQANVKVSILKGSGVTVTADGSIESMIYKGYHYQDLNYDGTYSAKNVIANIHSDTDRNKFDLFGDITFGNGMKFVVNGDVGRLDLRPFLLLKGWKDPYVSLHIDGDMAGANLDEMTGTLAIENLSLVDSSFIYNPGAIYLQASADSGKGKRIQLMSSFLEADIQGDYYFSTIGKEMNQALHPHLPSLIVLPEDQQSAPGINNFQFNILLKNTEDISYVFALPFYNVDNATIAGNVEMTGDGKVQIDAHIPG